MMALKYSRNQRALPASGLGVFAQNERGAVLIIVMVMLLVLTILGVTVLTNSTTEVKIAGNYRNQQQAFYAAEGALEFSQVAPAIYDVVQTLGDPWTGANAWTGTISFGSGTATATRNAVATAGTANIAQVVAINSGSGSPPAGSGYDETFVANYYDFNITGHAPNATEAEVNATVAKMQAKP